MYNNLPKTLFIGKSVVYLPTCHSTNDIAASLLNSPDIFEGTVVVTSSQTAGKGQRGNSWEAEPHKNLTCSLIIKPEFLKLNKQFNLNIIISLALYDVLTNYLGEKVKIKWPNDIFFVNHSISKKICGILIQNIIKKDSIHHSIIGIGLNVNQENFKDSKAVSLKNILGQEIDIERVFREIMEKIEHRYLQLKELKFDALNKDYLQVLYWYRESHIFRLKEGEAFTGTITGIDEIGRLMIESGGGTCHFNFKEVEFIE